MGKRFYILFFVILALGSQPLNTYAENSESVVLDEAIFDFSLTSENDQVALTWDKFPDDAIGYQIERSFDGKRYSRVFESNSLRSLTYTDDLFSIPIDQVYYRFVFFFKDGDDFVSNSKLLSLTSQNHLKPDIFVSGDQIELTFYSSTNANTRIRVLNTVGSLVAEQQFRANKGTNTTTVVLYGLRRGMNFLQLEQNGRSTTTKFFIR